MTEKLPVELVNHPDHYGGEKNPRKYQRSTIPLRYGITNTDRL